MRSLTSLTLSFVLLGCGSKTALQVPDATFGDAPLDAIDEPPPDVLDVVDVLDAPDVIDVVDVIDVQDVPDVPDVACMPLPLAAATEPPELMFVIDRSGSMQDTLAGTRPMGAEVARWDVLRSSLSMVLPRYDSMLEMGAQFYPQPLDTPVPTIMMSCTPLATIEVPLARNRLTTLLQRFNETTPNGATPTHAALDQVARYLRSRPGRNRARAIVLATDGGPNCNDTLPTTPPCRCTSMDTRACAPIRGSNACFDDERTVSLIREIAAPTTDVQAIPVYVVGMVDPSSSDTELLRVLNAMADAGGRPSGSMTARYYSVRNLADVASAFERIVRSVNGCTFFARPVPTDLDDVSIRVGDFTVLRDRTRSEGWDWTDSPVGELTLFGGACMLASAGRPVTISVGCTRDR